MRNVTKELLNFAEFLNINWIHLNNCLDLKNFDRDQRERYFGIFIEANWEILVEMLICEEGFNLDYYASGADLFDLSERVIFPEKSGNSRITVFSESDILDELSGKKQKIDSWDFFKFVSYKEGKFYDYPPFDYVIANDLSGTNYLIKKENLTFFYILN